MTKYGFCEVDITPQLGCFIPGYFLYREVEDIMTPLYAKAMGTSLDTVVQSVSTANPYIDNLFTFLILATIPFNLIKIVIIITAKP